METTQTTQTIQTTQPTQKRNLTKEDIIIALTDWSAPNPDVFNESEKDILTALNFAFSNVMGKPHDLYFSVCDSDGKKHFLELENKYMVTGTKYEVFFKIIRLYLRCTHHSRIELIPDMLDPVYEIDRAIKNIENLCPSHPHFEQQYLFIFQHVNTTLYKKKFGEQMNDNRKTYALHTKRFTPKDIEIAKRIDEALRIYFCDDKNYISFTSLTDDIGKA